MGAKSKFATIVVIVALMGAPAVGETHRAAEAPPAGQSSRIRSSDANNFEVLGHVRLPGRAPDGDVWFYDHGQAAGKFAYVGTWRGPCTRHGVKIVDVNDPANPTLVASAFAGPSRSRGPIRDWGTTRATTFIATSATQRLHRW